MKQNGPELVRQLRTSGHLSEVPSCIPLAVSSQQQLGKRMAQRAVAKVANDRRS
jgi:hypothetical protein